MTAPFSDRLTLHQQPPISFIRNLPLPKRRNANIKWEKSDKYKPQKTIEAPESFMQNNVSTATKSSPITPEGTLCSSAVVSCYNNLSVVTEMDEEDALLVTALIAYDPSIALVFNCVERKP